jgi:hypothetical protein
LPTPPGQAVLLTQVSVELLQASPTLQGCCASPAGTQHSVNGAHCALDMQTLPVAQVPLTQASKGGSQHFDRPLGQLIDVHFKLVLQASLGPQGWSLAPEGTRTQQGFIGLEQLLSVLHARYASPQALFDKQICP